MCIILSIHLFFSSDEIILLCVLNRGLRLYLQKYLDIYCLFSCLLMRFKLPFIAHPEVTCLGKSLAGQ